eukprot:353176_1
MAEFLTTALQNTYVSNEPLVLIDNEPIFQPERSYGWTSVLIAFGGGTLLLICLCLILVVVCRCNEPMPKQEDSDTSEGDMTDVEETVEVVSSVVSGEERTYLIEITMEQTTHNKVGDAHSDQKSESNHHESDDDKQEPWRELHVC